MLVLPAGIIGDTQVEEERLPLARTQIPDCVDAFNDLLASLTQTLARSTSLAGAAQACTDHGLALWRAATQAVQCSALKDDRPLYWGRLQMLQEIRRHPFTFHLDHYLDPHSEPIDEPWRKQLMAAFEDASRGRTCATFTQQQSKRILVSGFDPFGFTTEREGSTPLVDLAVSNPSGAAALELSNRFIFHQGHVAEVQSAIFPVRYEDFDLGVVERFFRPYFGLDSGDQPACHHFERTRRGRACRGCKLWRACG
jgi:hypothetical protein